MNIEVDMANEMDTVVDFIVIDYTVFQKFRETHLTPLEHIESKADLLRKTYTCLQEICGSGNTHTNGHGHGHGDGNTKGEHNGRGGSDTNGGSGSGKWKSNRFAGYLTPSHQLHKNTTNNVKPEKLRIGTGGRELSKEDRMKRDFMSFVNRLSDGNRKNISTYFKTNFQTEFIDTYIRLIWEAMLRTEDFQHLYVDCLEEICMIVYENNRVDFIIKINDISSKYFNDIKWIPSIELINEANYDDFCDFVKWKKTSITYIHGFAKFINKEWLYVSLYDDLSTTLITSITKYLSEIPEGCKVTDALLEQLLVVLEYTKGAQDTSTRKYIEDLNERRISFRPSTRFKIYDIKEFLDRKLKYVVRGNKNT
jgi:hypothetical protein